jgi:hypothetical protein
VARPPTRVPGPSDVIGPPPVPPIGQADVDAAYLLGKQHAQAALDRQPLWRIARDRLDRWLRRR